MLLHSMFFSCHVGQAKNPGPGDDHRITIAVCNPTAVYGKIMQLVGLNADIICASETSATSVIQKESSRELSKLGFKSFWSEPVAPKKLTLDNRPSYRGEAVGTAIFTRVPSRQFRGEVPIVLKESQRFSACIVRIGQLEILFIALYGFANRHREGKRPNDLLLASIIPLICSAGLPFIVCGDFNEPIVKLPAFRFFRDLGVVEALQWYKSRTGEDLPPTCAGSTRNDSAFMHPVVADLLMDMHVLSDNQFDPHSPLLIQLSTRLETQNHRAWKMPKTWAPFAPSQDLIAKFYKPIDFGEFFSEPDVMTPDEIELAFLLWSQKVEKAVGAAIRKRHSDDPENQPRKDLHSSFKGRCNFKQITSKPRQSGVKSDRHGGYTPPNEVFSLQSKQKIRQVRRLKTLLRRYKTLPLSTGSPSDGPAVEDALKEWKCILNACGYGSKWKNWILGFEMIPAIPLNLPDVEVLEAVTQITQLDCDHACKSEAKMRADAFKNRIQVDIQHDFSKLTYKIIRAKETDRIREVPVKKCFNAVLLRSKVGGTCLRIDTDFQIPKFAKLRLGEAKLEFLKQCDRKIFFRHIDGCLDSQGVLEVSYTAWTPEEISLEFADFWKPMWQRDSRQQQFSGEDWSDFQAILQTCDLPHMPQIEIPWDDTDRWMKIIAKLPSAKAIGPCGWSSDELRCLPRICVVDLVWIFKQVAFVGFSPNLMKAKTILLSKIPIPLSMHHARPITILSCLHRLFGKFVFRCVADVWKDHFPFPISGGLPGRGVKELAYAQKRMIEDAIKSNAVLGGYSLDLIKAFNTFARYPSAIIMHRLGVPWTLLRSWLHSLDKLVRFPFVDGQISLGITSTTGVPEGCSISVLSMLALSCVFYFRTIRQHVFPFAYADNWSWMSKQQQAHLTAHRDVLAMTPALKLSIDHAKSWHWATTKQFRDFCTSNCQTQDGTDVSVKTCVKDLGEIVHYNKSVSLGFIKEKIAEAVTRVHRIEWIPCSLQKKAHLIQSCAWPMALYSADTTYIGKKHFVDLRRACVTALVGHWHSASPVMSCNFLSKFLMDPFLHTLCQCARIVRRLAKTAHSIAVDTVKAMVAYTGQRPFGPASAFRVYLNQVGWTIADNGDITGPDHFRCNVLKDHCKKIINTFKQMWCFSLLNLTDRKGIGEFLPDPALSIRMFSKLQDEEQQLIKLNIAGGYQTDSHGMTKSVVIVNFVVYLTLGNIDCLSVMH